jgi:hypothetical protein
LSSPLAGGLAPPLSPVSAGGSVSVRSPVSVDGAVPVVVGAAVCVRSVVA